MTFDLIGLPPTPEELDAFLKDNAPNAYEKVVDRLLASPAFGELSYQVWTQLRDEVMQARASEGVAKAVRA